MSRGRILVFGDSHSDALKRAHQERGGSSENAHLVVVRFSGLKNGNEIGDASARTLRACLLDDERNAERFLVHEQAVPLLPVVAQTLTVIGDENNGRTVVELVRLQIADEASHRLVEAPELTVVR